MVLQPKVPEVKREMCIGSESVIVAQRTEQEEKSDLCLILEG